MSHNRRFDPLAPLRLGPRIRSRVDGPAIRRGPGAVPEPSPRVPTSGQLEASLSNVSNEIFHELFPEGKIEIVDELPPLPDPNYPQGKVVFLTTGSPSERNKLYRSTGTEWTSAVPTVDLDGQITEELINDDAVTAAKLANLAILDRHLGGTARSQHGVFVEVFENPIEHWTNHDGGAGVETYPLNGVTGGKVYQADGKRWRIFPMNIPYDPSKLYRMRVRVRRTATGVAQSFYAGYSGVAADGVTLINAQNGDNSHGSQHYHVAFNANGALWPLDEWQEFTGWTTGHSSDTGEVYAPSPDPTNPKKMRTGVAYLRPMFIVNYNDLGSGSVTEIDYIAVDVFDEDGLVRTYLGLNVDGVVAADKVVSSSILANAIVAAKIAAGAVTTDKLAANAVTADQLAANSVIAGKINAGAVLADAIAAGAISADKLEAVMTLANIIRAVDGMSNVTFEVDGNTGDVTVMGHIKDESGTSLIEPGGFVRLFRRRSTQQSVANNTNTTVNFLDLIEDHGGFTIPSSTINFELPRAGHYLVVPIIRWTGSSSGIRLAWVERSLNGGSTWQVLPLTVDRYASVPGAEFIQRLVADIHVDEMQVAPMNSDGYRIRIRVRQTSGSGRPIDHASLFIWFVTSHSDENPHEGDPG